MIPKNDNVSFYYKLKALHKFVGEEKTVVVVVETCTRENQKADYRVEGKKKNVPLEKKKRN